MTSVSEEKALIFKEDFKLTALQNWTSAKSWKKYLNFKLIWLINRNIQKIIIEAETY